MSEEDCMKATIAYGSAKRIFLDQIQYYNELITEIEAEIESRKERLGTYKINMASYQYALAKLEEDFNGE